MPVRLSVPISSDLIAPKPLSCSAGSSRWTEVPKQWAPTDRPAVPPPLLWTSHPPRGGGTGQPSPLATAGTLVRSMTCPTADTCMLLGDASGAASNSQIMFTTTDGGQSWTTLPLPGGEGTAALLLSCATALNCDS